MLSDISQYVSMAFDVAGDLVKKLTINEEVRGDFNPSTGNYNSTYSSFVVDAIDDDEDEKLSDTSLSNKIIRRYIFRSEKEIKMSQTFVDDGKEFTITRSRPVQQNATVFIFLVTAEA